MEASAARRGAGAGALIPLALASGCCALIYQVAWLRLLRLVFGTSTAASAAVTAIFLGGLGAGALALGRRADRSRNPIRLYAYLEFGVAIAAALSPFLIGVVHNVYVAAGGAATLGKVGGTGVRLVLSALVLGVPALLMGGTLPALVRAAERATDLRRRMLGVLYGTNTLGAVAGTFWTTFVSLERLGVRATIWTACILNIAIALAALLLARRFVVDDMRETDAADIADASAIVDASAPPMAPIPLVLVAAGAVGFVFFVMELVWYRMLTPLLGGSSYTFGLILAIVLLGIGVGGIAYAAVGERRRPTLAAFAVTCALEALCIAASYALGDRVALFALAAHDRATGFGGFVWGWSLVTLLVVAAPAVVAGYQFPLLVGLLGTSRHRVGEDVGRAYATNTLGAIVGSLAGGFGLLPVLTAPGLWRLTVYLLAALALLFAAVAVRRGRGWRAAIAVPIAAAAVAACFTSGPTSFWRHSGIGAGRLEVDLSDANAIRASVNKYRHDVVWSADGVESAVALDADDAYAFIVNGKSDGNVVSDAPTQVMLGLLGAVLHPNPKRALVIGLGTGESAGWLAHVPSIEAVDVFELEPAIVRVAEASALANQQVLSNPKVHLVFGDARELLLTTKQTYDVIASEPSNPYRAGIASLFTKEFYDAVAARLAPGGVFVQWLQAYEVRPDAVRSIYATLGAVFPAVETWELQIGTDLAFVAGREALAHDIGRLRARLDAEPYRTALAVAWGVGGVEGLYSGFLGSTDFAADFRSAGPAPVTTDDLTLLEFAFARSVGQPTVNIATDMRRLATERSHGRPAATNGSIDWDTVDERRVARAIAEEGVVVPGSPLDPNASFRQEARRAYSTTRFVEAARQWRSQNGEPAVLSDLRIVAESFASDGDGKARGYIDALRAWQPVEAEALTALFARQTGQLDAMVDHLVEALRLYRTHPWTHRPMLFRVLNASLGTLERNPAAAARVFDALSEPFAVRALDSTRLRLRALIGFRRTLEQLCVPGLAPLEPHVPWEEEILRGRAACYDRAKHPLASRARADLTVFLSNAQQGR